MQINGYEVDPRVRPQDRESVYGKAPAVLHDTWIRGCGDENCIFTDSKKIHQADGVCRCVTELSRTPEGKKAMRTIAWLRDQLDRKHEEVRHIWNSGYRPNDRRDGF
jgi:hypothetical protein